MNRLQIIDIEQRCHNYINTLLEVDSDITIVKNPIKIIPPYLGEAEIKLIIIGQDPTVKNPKSRDKIKVTLNLNEENNGALKRYIENQICKPLGLTLDNVYATNLFKYFYSAPPAKHYLMLKKHSEPNIDLLKDEIAEFSNVPIITLGEPLLRLLSNDKAKLRNYWGYDGKTKMTAGLFNYVSTQDSRIGRWLFPFPHQPSTRKQFYKETIEKYINFVKEKM